MGLSYASSTELDVIGNPQQRLAAIAAKPKIVSSPMSLIQPAAQTSASHRPSILNLMEPLQRSPRHLCKGRK